MDKKKILAIVLMGIGMILAIVSIWTFFNPVKEDGNKEAIKSKKIAVEEVNVYKKISGNAYESKEGKYTSVLIFADYNEKSNYQSLNLLTIGGKNRKVISCKYSITDDGKTFVYNPEEKYPTKVDFKLFKNAIKIDDIKYKKVDINKYSD